MNNTEQQIFATLHTLLDKAYSPYSQVKVASAIVFSSDQGEQVAYGVNIENVSYGLTSCAERSAIAAARLEGMHKILGVYVLSNQSIPISPCGACRQVLGEFEADASTPVICSNYEQTKFWRSEISQLLPNQFHL